jgi:ferredoxin
MTSTADLVGRAVPNVTDWQFLNLNYVTKAKIDQDACIKCGRCYAACEDTSHQAILMKPGRVFEVNDAADVVTKAAHPDANIIFGAVIDDSLGDEVKVTVIAAGFDATDKPLEHSGSFIRTAPAPVPDVVDQSDHAENDNTPAQSEPAVDPFTPVIQSFSDDTDPDDELDVPSFLR